MAALIPFGIDRMTGAIREVGDVPRGRGCGCICPSCKAGLVARHGSEKEWHFAHDQKGRLRPDKACDISFESACRLFVIGLLKSGEIPVVTTPTRELLSARGERISKPGARLEQLQFLDSEEYDDVKAEVDGYVLEIFIDYHSRVIPDPPRRRESTGVLAFPVAEVRRRYRQGGGGSGMLAKIVRETFAEEDGSKRWLYHPSSFSKLAAPRGVDVVTSEGMHSDPQIFSGSQDLGGLYGQDKPLHSSGLAATVSPIKYQRRRDERGHYRCYRCDYTWEGGELSGRVCAQCGSDGCSVFKPSQ